MKFGVVVFPGTNNDHDCEEALGRVLGQAVRRLWHRATDLEGVDCVILPGGFSYGDYLRVGAIARFAPIMEAVLAHARRGAPVLGICNGFQILLEAGLLPGAMLRNRVPKFICEFVHLRVGSTATPFTHAYREGQLIRLPIAHGDGNYFAEADVLAELTQEARIIFRYCNARGEVDDAANPNGSLLNIAGICNRERNVLGMMPHPERASDALLGSTDGLGIFQALLGRAGA
ncbi:MAG: phosphoribosylformylglycinamidine synthase subunit PurQ [Candidatus Tectomicrobia bacterium]|nr:phosphoribosylformylglycinamidine synthase subunit PurQ [Candidatus Tectomicrobia bacterium]